MTNDSKTIDNNLNELIVHRIKGICEEKNITAYRLAKLSNLHRSTLSWLLNESYNNIKTSTIVKICYGLNITIADFFNHPSFR